MSVGSEIFLILLFIVINGIFVMSEMAIASSRQARLQQRINDGDKKADAALKLNQDPNMFLATVQIGITLISVLTGVIGGATFAEPLGKILALIPISIFSRYSESIALGIVVVSITTVSIVVGELLPKRIALHNPELIASTLAGPMIFVSKVFTPLVWLFSRFTDGLLRLLGIKPGTEPPVTEEEIHLLIDQGTQAGVFEESEQDMVQGIFNLGNQRIYSLMTPRTDIIYLDITDTVEEIRTTIAESEFSRFPLRQHSLDTILGIVKARDLLVRSLSGGEIRLKELLKPAFFIPETMFAARALEVFKEKGTELLLVIDEFGGLQGLLTINDVLEEIVGQIEMEEPQATQRQDGSWLLDGMLEVDEFKEIFKVKALPHEDEYETLSGFVMVSLGRVPQSADLFEWNGLRFEVVDMDGRRVDKVLVTTLPQRAVIP